MASRKDKRDEQDWTEAEELFARGDTTFVDRLRRIHNADLLAGFAARWFADRRPEARQLLRDYLSRPLNAYRHEGLVKRLFKMAEAAGDDELMAYFLVLFDRSIRRVKRKKYHWESRTVDNRETAQALLNQWESSRVESSGINSWGNRSLCLLPMVGGCDCSAPHYDHAEGDSEVVAGRHTGNLAAIADSSGR